MNLPAYPKYKKSGVGLLGDVPEHWEVKRLKFLGKSIIGLTYNPSGICNKAEGTLVLRASNIQNGKTTFSDNVYVSSPIPSNLTTRTILAVKHNIIDVPHLHPKLAGN